MEHKKKAKVVNKATGNDLEKQKIDLVKLRIKNRFYERDEVFERVVEEILNRTIKPKN